VLPGADFYEDGPAPDGLPPVDIGRDVVLNRTIIHRKCAQGRRVGVTRNGEKSTPEVGASMLTCNCTRISEAKPE